MVRVVLAIFYIVYLVGISAMHDTRSTNIGFFILPRHNYIKDNEPKVMTLEDDGNWYFSDPSNIERQVFIVKSPYGNKLCLKHDRSICLRTEKAIKDKDITRYRRRKCEKAISKNRIELVPSPYKNFFLIQMRKCLIYCLYSHEPNNRSKKAEPVPNISKCNYSNINSHFYLLNEFDLNLHFPDLEILNKNVEPGVDEKYPHVLDKKQFKDDVNPLSSLSSSFEPGLENRNRFRNSRPLPLLSDLYSPANQLSKDLRDYLV